MYMITNDDASTKYTRIPNSVLDWLFGPEHDLSFRQVRILLVAFRYTYGFSRRSAPLSSRFVADRTGLDQSDCSKTLRSLTEAGLLAVSFERKIGFYTIVPKAYKNKKTRKVVHSDEGDLPSRGCFTLETEGDSPSKKQRKKDGSSEDAALALCEQQLEEFTLNGRVISLPEPVESRPADEVLPELW
jgi:phage replication O-like protein O